MIKAILQHFFIKGTKVASSKMIHGNMSNGRQDSPGVWWKA
jgi:hypothetical protein